jgi:branched-chain amino acid transport system substrate-binding protein
MRKTFTDLGLGALLSAGLAISVATTAPTAAFADDTVKIGVLLIDSGPLAGLKETQVKAVNLAIEQINAAGGAAHLINKTPTRARRPPRQEA